MMYIEETMRNRRGNDKGFTLIEIIAVLIILAIVSAVLILRVTATDTARLRTEIDTLKSHIRYAQYLALNDISPIQWGINIGGSSYTLVKYDNGVPATTTYILPNESSATHNFSTPITASSTVNPILFDEWGSPGAANIDITIGGQTITGAIKARTGYVP